MIQRDFTNESVLNFILRAKCAFFSRLRGRILSCMNVFALGSSKCFTIGIQPKILNSKAIFLGYNVSFRDLCRIECYFNDSYPMKNVPKITIGQNSSFGDLTHIGALNHISIGKNVLCAGKVLIIDHDHGKCGDELIKFIKTPPRLRELISKGPIRIGDNVWIGESSVILAGSDIGDGAVIGANSVVFGHVPAGSVFINKGPIFR